MRTEEATYLQHCRNERDAALEKLRNYHRFVSSKHYPEAVPIPNMADEEGDPLAWVRINVTPPREPTPPPPPPPPPSRTPLPPCSFEKEWLELESERSEREYRRLRKLYGSYLAKGEAGLIGLWTALGGCRYWRTKLRPSQLTLLLSRETTRAEKLCFRFYPNELLMAGGVVMPLIQVEGEQDQGASRSEQWVGFCSNLLPRLPYLRHLTLVDAPIWPFDTQVLDKTSYCFPVLTYVHLPLVHCTSTEVVSFIERIPTLAKEDGIWIDEHCFRMDGRMKRKHLESAARGRLTIRSKNPIPLLM